MENSIDEKIFIQAQKHSEAILKNMKEELGRNKENDRLWQKHVKYTNYCNTVQSLCFIFITIFIALKIL